MAAAAATLPLGLAPKMAKLTFAFLPSIIGLGSLQARSAEARSDIMTWICQSHCKNRVLRIFDFFSYLTNPYPRLFPVCLSVMTTASSISPYTLKWSRRLLSVVWYGSPPTNSLVHVVSFWEGPPWWPEMVDTVSVVESEVFADETEINQTKESSDFNMRFKILSNKRFITSTTTVSPAIFPWRILHPTGWFFGFIFTIVISMVFISVLF